MAPHPDTLLALASGVPLALLGGLLLAIRPRRSHQVVFGTFAVLWGLQVVTANLGRVILNPHFHHRSLLISYGFLAATSLFLVHFASRVSRREWSWVPSGVAGLLGIAAGAVLALEPSLLVQSVALRDGQLITTFGPLALPLVQAPFFLAFYYAILMLYIEYRRSEPGTARHRVRGLVLAFTLFASYVSARQLALLLFPAGPDGVSVFASSAVRLLGSWSALAQTGLFVAGALLLVTLSVHLTLRPPPPEGRDYALLLAFLIPAVTAVAEALFLQQGFILETLGFWRFVTMGVLVYTLARYQLFDLDLKLKGWAGPGTAGLLVAFGVPLALTFAGGDVSPMVLVSTFAVEGIAVGASLMFRDRISETLFPGARDTEGYVHQRRLDVYKVALEDALERGQPPDAPELREVRLRLGISDREHDLLVWVLRGTHAAARTTETVQARSGEVLLETYRLGALLGEGTAGRTFVAHDLRERRTVALKVVSATALGGEGARLLLRDARLLAAVSHPNVVHVIDVAEIPGGVALVMEYAERGNLEGLLARRGPLAPGDAVRMLDDVLNALGAMHAKGLVHRNLKPKNLLFAKDGSARLSDFAAARAGDAEAPGALEDAAAATLSLLYMSPEQVLGEPAGPGSDLYVAAVLFHQALTGRHPIPVTGKDDSALRDLILHGEPELALPRKAAALEPFLRRALARDPAERFATAAEMRAALRAAAAATPPATVAPRAPA